MLATSALLLKLRMSFIIGFKGLTTLESKSSARLLAFGVGVEKSREKELEIGLVTRSV